MEFLGDRRAADHAAALEYRHRQAAGGEIARANQPVMTAADDDGVVAASGRHQRARGPPIERSGATYSSVIPAATIEKPQST